MCIRNTNFLQPIAIASGEWCTFLAYFVYNWLSLVWQYMYVECLI